MRTLSATFQDCVQAQLNAARSLHDVLRIAHVARVACGYRVTRHSTDYTATERAWFRSPMGSV